MISVSDVLQRLSVEVGGAGPAGWDVDGLQLGDPAAGVSTVGVCHEVTDVVLDRVQAVPVDLLIAYHPLLFRPVTAVVAGSGPAGRAFRLLSSHTALGIAHTSFDVAPGGTADALAEALSLSDVVGFGPAEPGQQIKLVTFLPEEHVGAVTDALGRIGAGVIGRYTHCSFRMHGTGTFFPGEGANPVVGSVGAVNAEDEIRLEMIAPASRRDALVSALVAVHPYEEPAFDVYEVVANTGFIGRIGSWSGTLEDLGRLVGKRLGASGLRVSGALGSQISRVAVVPGSGSDFLSAARSLGSDAAVTGDVAHHRIVAANDRGLGVIDPGHTPTERPGMAALVGAVDRAVAGGAAVVDLTDADPTPWR
ncbi:MAG: Nif3-like dinuclear metal center hexameric protein [Acidimicrobiia bacterium]|nr:Nif3-like dinuclear metal center hexameric protein [Acidimicrobiia bacterium]